tara:strand:- start:1016 stop:1315 length:300 start_codon:yes stop_codon:yes gene_type:complete
MKEINKVWVKPNDEINDVKLWIKRNELSNALCNIYDIENQLKIVLPHVHKIPKDNEGTDTTLGDIISEVTLFIEGLTMDANEYVGNNPYEGTQYNEEGE